MIILLSLLSVTLEPVCSDTERTHMCTSTRRHRVHDAPFTPGVYLTKRFWRCRTFNRDITPFSNLTIRLFWSVSKIKTLISFTKHSSMDVEHVCNRETWETCLIHMFCVHNELLHDINTHRIIRCKWHVQLAIIILSKTIHTFNTQRWHFRHKHSVIGFWIPVDECNDWCVV